MCIPWAQNFGFLEVQFSSFWGCNLGEIWSSYVLGEKSGKRTLIVGPPISRLIAKMFN